VSEARRIVEPPVADEAGDHRADLLVPRGAERTRHHRPLDEVGVSVGGAVLQREGDVELPRLQDQPIAQPVAEGRERQIRVSRRERARRDVRAGGRRRCEVARNVEVEQRAEPAAKLDAGTAHEGAALGGLLPEEGAVDLQPSPGEKNDRAVAAAQEDPVREVPDGVRRGRVVGARPGGGEEQRRAETDGGEAGGEHRGLRIVTGRRD
jgi:hypothetical protein